MARKKILISGHVQGVFFRADIRELAEELGIKGTVRNLPDTKVEVIAEGDEDKIQELVNFCKKGPSRAQVKAVDVSEYKSEKKFEEFEIIY